MKVGRGGRSGGPGGDLGQDFTFFSFISDWLVIGYAWGDLSEPTETAKLDLILFLIFPKF